MTVEFKHAATPSDMRFRLGLCGYFLACGFLALWILWPAVLASIETKDDRGEAARQLAKDAVLRGDLWTNAALAQAERLFQITAADRSFVIRTGETAERAVRLSPHDARLWLVLAAAELLQEGARTTGFLKMSYYTGTNEISLMPRRFLVAAAAGADDEELRAMMRGELRTMARRRPKMDSAIEAAWRAGTPQAQALIAATLADIDPHFARRLRAGDTR